MKEPTKAEKAVEDPTYTAPMIVLRMAQARVALRGEPQVWFTLPTQLLQGVAPSRPSV